MVSQTELIQRYNPESWSNPSLSQHYQCDRDLNIYDSPQLSALATQAVATRQLRILSLPPLHDGQFVGNAIPICLYEDDYPGWLAIADVQHIHPIEHIYCPPCWSAGAIRDRIPATIAFAKAAMGRANYYLWGGVLGPNYDCSGLIQAAFRSVGIWLPRDAYQQEAFTQSITLAQLQPGDLIFFGPKERANHVALYLGDRHYIHSSGKTMGRNGIGIDILAEDGDPISQAYYRQVHGAGRVVASYQPTGIPIKAMDDKPVTPIVP